MAYRLLLDTELVYVAIDRQRDGLGSHFDTDQEYKR